MQTIGQKGDTHSKITASGLRNLMLMCGFLLVAFSRPVSADACGEFRIALALEDAARQARETLQKSAVDAGTDVFDWGESAEGKAALTALKEATHRTEVTAQAVREGVDDAVTATMIDAFIVAREKMALAHRAVTDWFAASLGRPIYVFRSATGASRAIERAYRDSLKAACDGP